MDHEGNIVTHMHSHTHTHPIKKKKKEKDDTNNIRLICFLGKTS